MHWTVVSALVVARAVALQGPWRVDAGLRLGVKMEATVPASDSLPPVQYAAKMRSDVIVTRSTFIGEYELEEREDKDSCKTLLELLENGHILLGQTDGVPFTRGFGQWEYTGEGILTVKLHREYENLYTTSRVLVGDVIALDRTPPTVEGNIKAGQPHSDDIHFKVKPHVEENIGYFTAIKITAAQNL